jgi:hypothetical protein
MHRHFILPLLASDHGARRIGTSHSRPTYFVSVMLVKTGSLLAGMAPSVGQFETTNTETSPDAVQSNTMVGITDDDVVKFDP